jgi:hypothetical protein
MSTKQIAYVVGSCLVTRFQNTEFLNFIHSFFKKIYAKAPEVHFKR